MSKMSDLDIQAASLLNDGLKRLSQAYRGTADYCRGDKRPERGMVYDEMARRVDALRDAAASMFDEPEAAVAGILGEQYGDHVAVGTPEEATA